MSESYNQAMHRKVAERALGKPLPPGAEVHHVNRNEKDNRPQNLVICQDRAYHRLLHANMRARNATPPPDWARVKSKAALEGITLKALIERLLRVWLETSAASSSAAPRSSTDADTPD